jgi:WhiB family transcriptional regulator, redox-sensing transcriptional regulator
MASSLVRLMTRTQALDYPLPCHRENPELRFSERPTDLQFAKSYCRPCPLRQAYLADAIVRHEPCGVWGRRPARAGRSPLPTAGQGAAKCW